MASFVGTNKEFRRYIGPRLRNLVQQFTKNHKAEISACEHCGSKENLESAHVHGRDRNEILDLVLSENTYNSVVTVDVAKLEERFKDEHQPLEKSILILCRSCHKKYGSKAPKKSTESVTQQHDSENHEGYLPITLEPSDPDVFKKELLITKQAIIETYYFDSSSLSDLDCQKFDRNRSDRFSYQNIAFF